MNNNKNITFLNLWNTRKVGLIGKFIPQMLIFKKHKKLIG